MLRDQDPYGPHTECVFFLSLLGQWSTGKQKSSAFVIAIAWRESKRHVKECYFCSCVVDGYNVKNLTCLVPCDQFLIVPIPLPQRVLETVEDFVSEKSWSDSHLRDNSEYEVMMISSQSYLTKRS